MGQKTEWIEFEDGEQVKTLHLYLARAGSGGYILKSEVIGYDSKVLHRGEKRYPRKELNDMRFIIRDLYLDLKWRNLPITKISLGTNLMNFRLPDENEEQVKKKKVVKKKALV